MKPLIGEADGFSQEAYKYAAGNVETLLSYYAIPGPCDDPVDVLRKRRVTTLLELGIGELLQARGRTGMEDGLNTQGEKLVAKWAGLVASMQGDFNDHIKGKQLLEFQVLDRQ